MNVTRATQGNQPQVERVPGEQVPGNQVQFEQVQFGQVPGEQVPGEQVQGNQVPGEQPAGELRQAHQVTGDAPRGTRPSARTPSGSSSELSSACPSPARWSSARSASASTPEDALERVRDRIRASQGAAKQARRTAALADEALSDVELLRRRLPVASSAAERARRSVRALRRVTPVSLWYAGRRELTAERARRSATLRSALAEREALATRIAEQVARARDLRAKSLRLRATASGLPRQLDEAAAYLRRAGGPAADSLAAAEAGLEPVLRRESDLDQALRWVRWAQLHLETSLDRLGDGRTLVSYGQYFVAAEGETVPATGWLLCHDAVGGLAVRRIEAVRQTLAGVRDVLTVLNQALGDLRVNIEPLTVPDVPADLEVWLTGAAGDPDRQARVISALEASERAAVQVATLLERVEGDYATTRRVLDSRRAHWCALLLGE
jgi:hypothetical protein